MSRRFSKRVHQNRPTEVGGHYQSPYNVLSLPSTQSSDGSLAIVPHGFPTHLIGELELSFDTTDVFPNSPCRFEYGPIPKVLACLRFPLSQANFRSASRLEFESV